MDAFHAKETVSNSAAGVAGSCHEHVKLLSGAEMRQQAGHETGSYIFESECRTMEQLQGIDAVVNLGYGAIEGQGVTDDGMKLTLVDILSEESICHGARHLMEIHLLDVLEERIGQTLDALGHVEAAVFGKAFDHGFLKAREGSLAIGAVVSHWARSLAPLLVTFTT